MAESLDRLVREAAHSLNESGVLSARADAELLAGHVLGEGRGRIAAMIVSGAEVSEDEADRLRELTEERARRIPLQHLTGRAPFRTLELRVGPGAFIPRPETETVVAIALTRLRRLLAGGAQRPRVVDLGTGSGAIAAALAAECPEAEVHAVELSEEAAAWAEMNFAALPSGSAPVVLHRSDLRDFPAAGAGAFDLVVSNPPYIPGDMVPTEAEVREHDPELALYGGGEGGLEMPFAVVDVAEKVLGTDGWFIMEHAEVQAARVAAHCEARPALTDVRTHQDLSGRDRATSAVLGLPEGGDVAKWRA